ncbi:MAG: carbamoyltransferase HypF [bacterium]
MPPRNLTAFITLTGQVQGIGFRPYVYRLAHSLKIKGAVTNTKAGVKIVAQGKNLSRFIQRLKNNPPPLSTINCFDVSYSKSKCYKNFTISKSKIDPSKKPGVYVIPDIALCHECRKELLNPKDRRFLYPFINCTQCGPRYTIIFDLPYDRERTTMKQFSLCTRCAEEYLTPLNRRFHAEPIACPVCGPSLTLFDQKNRILPGDPIIKAATALVKGRIVAIKSLGGYHLACDATSDQAVKLLRRRKERSRKPFAVMVEDANIARLFCRLSPTALRALNSPRAPIVLAPKLRPGKINISPFVAPSNPYIGVMVAYTPVHLLLFKVYRQLTKKPAVLVMTSANKSDEPIAQTDLELQTNLARVYDLSLSNNRDIANRCDDSVVMTEGKKTLIVRRSRGYAPQPITLGKMFHVKHPTLAIGGDGRNVFALARREEMFLSPHIGELESNRNEQFLLATLDKLIRWTGIRPERVICDLHPDYHSVRLAEELAERWRVDIYRVQHHYAHILSVITEHNLTPPVIGLACDGTGYGLDGTIWGCEIILVRFDLSWERLAHLGYLRHSAGGGALADPVKVGEAYCAQAGVDKSKILSLGLTPIRTYQTLPYVTSSLGRLFDAVAAITGVCQKATFEGEAAVALENAAIDAGKLTINLPTFNSSLDPRPLLRWVVDSTLNRTPTPQIALGFHHSLVLGLGKRVAQLARTHGVNKICLSGGSIQNSLLRKGLKKFLARRGLTVYHNETVPLNDGGIALGQAVAPVY